MNLHERFSPHNANAHFMYLYARHWKSRIASTSSLSPSTKNGAVYPSANDGAIGLGRLRARPHCCQPQRDLARADCFTPAPKKTFRAHESKTARLLLAPRTIWGGFRALKWSGFVPAWMSWLSAGANVARNSGRLCGERLGGLPCTQRPLCTVTASSKHSVYSVHDEPNNSGTVQQHTRAGWAG